MFSRFNVSICAQPKNYPISMPVQKQKTRHWQLTMSPLVKYRTTLTTINNHSQINAIKEIV